MRLHLGSVLVTLWGSYWIFSSVDFYLYQVVYFGSSSNPKFLSMHTILLVSIHVYYILVIVQIPNF